MQKVDVIVAVTPVELSMKLEHFIKNKGSIVQVIDKGSVYIVIYVPHSYE